MNRFLNAAPVRRLAARRVRVAPGTKVAVSKITVSPKAGTLTNPITVAKAKNFAFMWPPFRLVEQDGCCISFEQPGL